MIEVPETALIERGAPHGGSGEMFDAIATRYDFLNRVLSLGIDRGWRRRVVEALDLGSEARVIDHATGTADLAIEIARRYPTARVHGLDPSANMLRVGRNKVGEAGVSERVALAEGDAQRLEAFADDEVDAVCMAFGIRNVPDREQALREFARVTRPGGRIVLLELSEPRGGLLGPVARWHVHVVVPFLGGLLSGSREYRYLQRSIAAFPAPERFAQTMRDCGIEVLQVDKLSFGACHLYVGRAA